MTTNIEAVAARAICFADGTQTCGCVGRCQSQDHGVFGLYAKVALEAAGVAEMREELKVAAVHLENAGDLFLGVGWADASNEKREVAKRCREVVAKFGDVT